MLRITMIALLCVAAVGTAFFVFWAKDQNVHPEAQGPRDAPLSQPPPAGSKVHQEAQGHLDKLYALSGRLTPEEKKYILIALSHWKPFSGRNRVPYYRKPNMSVLSRILKDYCLRTRASA